MLARHSTSGFTVADDINLYTAVNTLRLHLVARGRSGVLRMVTAAMGRSGALRAQPEVVQAHGLRIYLFRTSHLLLMILSKNMLNRVIEGSPGGPQWWCETIPPGCQS